MVSKKRKIKTDNYEKQNLLGNLYHKLRDECNLTKADKVGKIIFKENFQTEAGLGSLVYSQDQNENLKYATNLSQQIVNRLKNQKRNYVFSDKNTLDKIHIGYISSDFKDHATSHLLLGILKSHNHDIFNIYTYSYGKDDKSCYREKIQKLTKFRDITNLSDIKACDKIFKDKIDILVDLKGHTENSRFEIFALKPAPIQVSFLGYPGTTGSDFMNFLITDKIVTPPDAQKYYTEKFAYIKNTYQPTDNLQEISTQIKTRKDCPLPENSFLFCSFNQPYKFETELFNSWSKILKKVPQSHLCLLAKNDIQRKNIINEFKKRNINKNRIIFTKHLTKDKHLSRLALCDLSLDTFTYNGHTTTSDSLYAGVPVITLKGKHFASRVSASLLTAIGLPELITNSQKEYEDLAVNLAKNPKKLVDINKSLSLNRKLYPLFNTNLYVKNLEKLYQDMFKSRQSYREYYNLGCRFYSQGNYPEALKNFKKAVNLNPQFSPALNDMGNIYKNTHDYLGALKSYLEGLKYLPNSAIILTNLGVVYSHLQNWQLAINYFVKAIKIDPTYTEAYYGLGVSYYNADFWQKAIDTLQSAIKINPNFYHASSFLTFLKMQACDFYNIPKYDPSIDSPILSVSRFDDLKINLKAAKKWSSEIENKMARFPKFVHKTRKMKKITIGYLSNDFYNHATSYLINNLFSNHDKNKFNINIYSYGPLEKNYYLDKFKKEVNNFTDISKTSDYEASKKIYSDKVDILVDLKGFTGESRMEILATHPAPVQISWLGFPGTSGSSFIDYIITDKIICPKADKKYYVEKFAYMPDTYQINDSNRKISNIKYKRSDFKLPIKKNIVFCCFNRPTKIEPSVFKSWMKILKKVPNSVLWLWKENDLMVKNLKKEAKKYNVNPKRLTFSSSLSHDKHLKRIKLADIALDTFTYNGHTTTSDCLWAGVPVISLKGKHFASRVSASLLTAIGLPELITSSQKEYEDLAVNLAKNPKKLLILRNSLERKRLNEPLFDTKKFVKNLEKLYTDIYE